MRLALSKASSASSLKKNNWVLPVGPLKRGLWPPAFHFRVWTGTLTGLTRDQPQTACAEPLELQVVGFSLGPDLGFWPQIRPKLLRKQGLTSGLTLSFLADFFVQILTPPLMLGIPEVRTGSEIRYGATDQKLAFSEGHRSVTLPLVLLVSSPQGQKKIKCTE